MLAEGLAKKRLKNKILTLGSNLRTSRLALCIDKELRSLVALSPKNWLLSLRQS
jgi:hypothetical protein